jgi:hypothetical protein
VGSMYVVALVVYALCDLVGILVAFALPDGPWTPYVPVVVAYHLFLIFRIISLAIGGEQKIGLSMPIPMLILTHLAFLGGQIGVVFGREYIPLFSLLRYAVPALSAFEAKWLFEGKRKARVVEDKPLPPGSADDYNEFLQYLREKDRRFQKPGRSIHEEFEAWSADKAKRRAAEQTESETA